MSGARLLGLDLAWSPRNPSGAAALAPDGRLLDARADLGDDAEVLAWIRAQRGTSGVIGIDMPTIVRNPAVRAPANATSGRLRGAPRRTVSGEPGCPAFATAGGRAAVILDRLACDGVPQHVRRRAAGPSRGRHRDVFPHAAHVALFGLDRIRC